MLACFIACKTHLEFTKFDFLNGDEILVTAVGALTGNKWSNIRLFVTLCTVLAERSI